MKGVEGHRQDFEVYPEWDGNQRSGLSKGCRNMPFVLWSSLWLLGGDNYRKRNLTGGCYNHLRLLLFCFVFTFCFEIIFDFKELAK